MKVLHLPTTVGGMNWGLAQGEKRLGLDATVLIRENNWLNYPFDVSLGWEGKSRPSRFLSALTAFLKYRNAYDVFHFNFGTSMIDFQNFGIHHWDLPFYPKNKKLIFTYNGCDARQKFKTIERAAISACAVEGCYGGMCMSGKLDKRREKRIRIASAYAHHMFAVNPDLMYFLPPGKSSFLPYAISGWYGIETLPYKPGRTLHIVHAPTNRDVKGSLHVIKAVESLKKKYDVELALVENMPNERAIEVYREADIVVDQLLAGWYGGFAVEAMKMGKPVAVYIREEDLKFIPPAMSRDLKDAVINVNPGNIEQVLERCMEDRAFLALKSRASVEYVNRWHDPEYVAGITKAVYEGS